jgi:glucose-6-phosphate isomerase
MFTTPTTTAPHHKCTDCPQFTALHYAASTFRNDDKLHLKHLLADAFRCQGLVAVHSTSTAFERGFGNDGNNLHASGASGNGLGEGTCWDKAQEKTTVRRIILDYSRQQITGSTLELLFDLADRMGLTERMSELRSGYCVNYTEKKAVLHHLLRMPLGYYKNSGRVQMMGGEERLKEVWDVIGRISSFSDKVRDGTVRGITGKMLKNVLCITAGGTHYGPEAVYEALRADRDASEATMGRDTTLSFLSNVDPVDFDIKTRNLEADETLFIVISKSFDAMETMYNVRMARRWLKKTLKERHQEGKAEFSDMEMIEKHFCAVTADSNQALQVRNVKVENVFDLLICISKIHLIHLITSSAYTNIISTQCLIGFVNAFLFGLLLEW